MTHKNRQKGFMLVFLIAWSFIIMALVAAVGNVVVANFYIANKDKYRVSTQLAVDGAISHAISEISSADSWSGTGGVVELSNSGDTKVVYETTVTNVNANTKTVNITARVYQPATASEPIQTRKAQVGLSRSGQPPVSFGVVVGQGGLSLSGLSSIDEGIVYINGRLSLSSVSRIGSSTTPSKVYVADQVCPIPADATFPRVCTSSESSNPITLLPTSSIYGEVRANNQVSGSRMFSPGLIVGESVAPAPMPSHDRSSITSNVATTMTGASASCSGFSTVTWPPNVKITGNVTATSLCKIIVQGNAWVTGNVSVTSAAIMQVADSATNQPTLMIDGDEGLKISSTGGLRSNSTGLGFDVVTYYANAACNPGCTSLSGTDLSNSVNQVTIDITGSYNSPSSTFYARWTTVSIASAASTGALAGQKVEIKSAGSVNLKGRVPGFSSPTDNSGWKRTFYRQVFD